jgi:hypothetical protein
MINKLTTEQVQALTTCLSFNSDHIYNYNKVTGNFDVETGHGSGRLSIGIGSIINSLLADMSLFLERAYVIKETLDSIDI